MFHLVGHASICCDIGCGGSGYERGSDRHVIRIVVGVADEIQFKTERVLLDSSSTEYPSVGTELLLEGHGHSMTL